MLKKQYKQVEKMNELVNSVILFVRDTVAPLLREYYSGEITDKEVMERAQAIIEVAINMIDCIKKIEEAVK